MPLCVYIYIILSTFHRILLDIIHFSLIFLDILYFFRSYFIYGNIVLLRNHGNIFINLVLFMETNKTEQETN